MRVRIYTAIAFNFVWGMAASYVFHANLVQMEFKQAALVLIPMAMTAVVSLIKD